MVQILKESYTLPFRIQPKLSRSPTVISCYVNPHRNLYLLEALHQLFDKNTVELVQNQKSQFFNQLFLVPKHNNKWRPVLDLSKLKLFLKGEKGPRWQSGNTLASHLCGRGSIPVMAVSGKAGSCLPLVGSLQYRTLANYMYWFPLPFQLPVVI